MQKKVDEHFNEAQHVKIAVFYLNVHQSSTIIESLLVISAQVSLW